MKVWIKFFIHTFFIFNQLLYMLKTEDVYNVK